MIRYFICENCHRGYDADDTRNTNCPYCKSDNVRPARKPSGALKYVGIVMVFAFFCAIGLVLPLDQGKDEVQDVAIEPAVPQVVVTEPEIDTTVIPVVKEVTVPVMRGEAYSFKVSVEIPSGDKVRLFLMEEFGEDPIYVSMDGNFKDVAPVKGGVYKLVAENAKTGDRSEEVYVSGCNPVQKIEKLTAVQMQEAFNSGTIPSKEFMAKFISSPKINSVGIDSSEPPVTNVGEVFNRIGSGLWISVEVSDVQYYSDNRISAFTVKVTY